MSDTDTLMQHRLIEDVLVDYCRHLDAMDLERLGALFTADCVVSYGDHPALVATGREVLVASLARMWRWRRTAHHLANVRIWPGPEGTARAESRVHAWHEGTEGQEAEVFGIYEDDLRLDGRAWRIARRVMRMSGSRGAFHVPLFPAERAAPPPGWVAPEGLDG